MPTICIECKHCQGPPGNPSPNLKSYFFCRVGGQKELDFVTGETAEEAVSCRDKNKGDCLDFEPKVNPRLFLDALGREFTALDPLLYVHRTSLEGEANYAGVLVIDGISVDALNGHYELNGHLFNMPVTPVKLHCVTGTRLRPVYKLGCTFTEIL